MMNKGCRDKLDRIKEQSYKLFLQNLLDKEERAYRKVRRLEFKYRGYRGDDRLIPDWKKIFDNVQLSDMIKI